MESEQGKESKAAASPAAPLAWVISSFITGMIGIAALVNLVMTLYLCGWSPGGEDEVVLIGLLSYLFTALFGFGLFIALNRSWRCGRFGSIVFLIFLLVGFLSLMKPELIIEVLFQIIAVLLLLFVRPDVKGAIPGETVKGIGAIGFQGISHRPGDPRAIYLILAVLLFFFTAIKFSFSIAALSAILLIAARFVLVAKGRASGKCGEPGSR